MKELTYYAGLNGQLKDEEAMYEEDIPTEQGSDQNNSEDSSDVLINPAAEGDFGRLQRDFIKSMGDTRNIYNMFGKPCIKHSLLHLLMLLPVSYL